MVRARTVVLGLVGFGGAYAAAVAGRHLMMNPGRPSVERRQRIDRLGGTELVVLYIGRSTCAWCNHPDLPPLLVQAKERFSRLADSAGWFFSMAGLAVDLRADHGLQHLERLSVFDQSAGGGGWSTLFGSPFLWEDGSGNPATPQVLVFFRHVARTSGDSSAVAYQVTFDRPAVRRVGLTELVRWQRQGFPLPLNANGARAPNRRTRARRGCPVRRTTTLTDAGS